MWRGKSRCLWKISLEEGAWSFESEHLLLSYHKDIGRQHGRVDAGAVNSSTGDLAGFGREGRVSPPFPHLLIL